MASEAEVRPPRSRFPGNALGLAAALAGLAVLAAFAPARLKLFGLFPAAVGAAAGVLVVRFLRPAVGGERRGRLLFAASVLVPLTLAAYGAGAWGLWTRAKAGEVEANLLAQPGGKAILERVRSERPPANEVEADFLAAYRRRMNPPPAAYLTDRLKGLPVTVPPAWAAAIAGAEFAAGWAAGVVAALLSMRRRGSGRVQRRESGVESPEKEGCDGGRSP